VREIKKIKEQGKLEKEKLLNILNQLRPALSTKPIVEELSHFHFCNDWVSAFNEDILMSADFYTGIECSVKADRFLKLLAGVKGNKVLFKKNKGELIIEGEKASFGLAYSELGDVFEKIESVEIGKRKKLPKDFLQALKLCCFSASQDMGDPEFINVCVDGSSVLSTDKARCSWYKLEEKHPKLLIPAYLLSSILNYDFKKYAYDGNWFHLLGDIEFSCLMKGGEYRSDTVKAFFPKEKVKAYEVPKEFGEVLGHAEILMENEFILDKNVTLYFEEKRVTIKANKKDIGWFEEEIPLKSGPKKSFELQINPVFLREVIKNSKTTKFYPMKELVMFESENGKFKHIISL